MNGFLGRGWACAEQNEFKIGKDFLPETQKTTYNKRRKLVSLTTLNLKHLSLKKHVTFKGVKRQATEIGDVWIYVSSIGLHPEYMRILVKKKNPDNPKGIWAQGWKRNIIKGGYPTGQATHKNLIKKSRKHKLNPRWDPLHNCQND